LEIRPGHCRKTALYHTLDGRDLVFLNRNRLLANTDDLNDSGSSENGQAIVWVHAAEEIAREQRQSDYARAVK
jgi:hypothetical protein